MNLYDLLLKLSEESLSSWKDKDAARELIKSLRDVNAFGTVIAGMEIDGGESHVHEPETRWCKFNPNCVEDVCKTCGTVVKPAYEPPWNRKRW